MGGLTPRRGCARVFSAARALRRDWSDKPCDGNADRRTNCFVLSLGACFACGALFQPVLTPVPTTDLFLRFSAILPGFPPQLSTSSASRLTLSTLSTHPVLVSTTWYPVSIAFFALLSARGWRHLRPHRKSVSVRVPKLLCSSKLSRLIIVNILHGLTVGSKSRLPCLPTNGHSGCFRWVSFS